MTKSITMIFVLIASHFCLGSATAQDLNDYMQNQLNQTEAAMQQYYAQMNQLDQQIKQSENQVVDRAMNDPRCRQMYQQYVNQGMPNGQLTFPQFAYFYAATRGFSQEGIAHYNQTTRDINAKDSAAVRNYQNYVNNLWQQTNQYRSDVYNRQQHDVGDLMTGSTTYTNPQTGETMYMPYTVQAGQTFTDYYGRTYTMDANGNYQMVNLNGYTYQMNPTWNR